jgi:hypothetical protein
MNVKESLLAFRNDLSQLLREATIPLSEHAKGERGLSDRERAAYNERVFVLKLIIELWDASFACQACHGQGDRHIETACYSGQATCPDCGGSTIAGVSFLFTHSELMSEIKALLVRVVDNIPPSKIVDDAETFLERLR